MTDLLERPRLEPDASTADRWRGWTLLGAAAVVAVVFGSRAAGLQPGALAGDLGIQYHLAGETAGGAVPLLDFTHTWNVGSWYFSAALHRLAGGDPSAWLYLWGTVFGPLLAGLAAVGVAWRLRLDPAWALVVVAGWLALSHVVHSKYAVPVVWTLLLLPVGRWAAGWRAVALRFGLAAVTFAFHVELAVLLGAGVALHDLVGVRGLGWRERAVRIAAPPLGVAVAFAVQSAVYAALGLPPSDLVRQLILNAGETAEGFTFGYPLLAPPSLRPKLFAVSLVVAFVPVVWRRLQPATRLVACLHLAQALIAIRRPDPTHVDAATTLLGLLFALLAHDLLTGRMPVGGGSWRGRRGAGAAGEPRAGREPRWAAALGAGWVAAALAAGFAIPHLVAIVALTAVLLAGVAAARTGDRPWASAGALAACGVLLAVSTVGGVAAALRSGDDDSRAAALAAALADPLDRCTGGQRTAWVVPEPLGLYRHLGLGNPTPYVAFWYSFTAEHERVRGLVDAHAIPAIIQVDGWPASFDGLADDLEEAFTPCATATAAGHHATIWLPHPPG